MPHILTPAERLRAWRLHARLSYRETARLFGVTPWPVVYWEAGKYRVPQRIIDRIESWNPDEVGRPVPTITWTRGNPFKARRKR